MLLVKRVLVARFNDESQRAPQHVDLILVGW
jgi:hypothetical protein